jgi:hypothetical protein
VVRGPAALLGAALVALAYVLAADALPNLGDGDVATMVTGGVGLGLVAAIVLSVAACGDALAPLSLLLAGSGLLVAVLDAAGAGPAAVVPEALLAGSVGVLAGRLLAAPVVALVIPLFVALVDAWSVASGPSERLLRGEPRGTDELSFALPAWGGGEDAARLGLVDGVFLAMFALWARRFGLRPRATVAGMLIGLLGTLALSLATDRAIPALPLVAVGYWLPNLDRLAGLLKADRGA